MLKMCCAGMPRQSLCCADMSCRYATVLRENPQCPSEVRLGIAACLYRGGKLERAGAAYKRYVRGCLAVAAHGGNGALTPCCRRQHALHRQRHQVARHLVWSLHVFMGTETGMQLHPQTTRPHVSPSGNTVLTSGASGLVGNLTPTQTDSNTCLWVTAGWEAIGLPHVQVLCKPYNSGARLQTTCMDAACADLLQGAGARARHRRCTAA